MTGASYRLAWATRGADNRLALALVPAVGSFAFGLVFAAASGQVSARLVYSSAGIATAALIGVDFPGAGHARWREFELSLPVAPIERARAGLVLSLGFWVLPLLATAALAQLGVFGEVARLPLESALGRSWVAGVSVLLAVALRHTFGLRATGAQTAALRVAMVAVVALGFFVPSTSVGVLALLAALPLFAIAHREAGRAPELSVRRALSLSESTATLPAATLPAATLPAATLPAGPGAPSASARLASADTSSATLSSASTDNAATHGEPSAHATFRRLALRYCVGTVPTAGLLFAMVLWTFGGTSGWLTQATWQVLFVPMWAAQHAGWGARLLRLGHLPFERARLFRFIVWPQLVALALGVGLALAWSPSAELGRLESRDGTLTLRAPPRSWRLTSGEPPPVTSPAGERHSPRAHSFGLGSGLIAYNPYEVPPGASRAFLTHQLGRLLADERGLSLSPDQIEERYLKHSNGWAMLDSDRYPELADPLARHAHLAGGALLLVVALLALHVPIRPGPALTSGEWRRSPIAWLLGGAFLLVALLQLVQGGSRDAADPIAIIAHVVSRPLASHAGLVLPAALGLAALLYRNLQQRFEQLEAPLRSKAMDRWFVEI